MLLICESYFHCNFDKIENLEGWLHFLKDFTIENYRMDFQFSRNKGNMMCRCIWDDL